MFTLAHLSDVHLGPLPDVRRRDLISKRITGYINWHRNRGHVMGDDTLSGLVSHIHSQKPDHIAVTGDMVNLALDTEIDNAAQWLGQLGMPETVSVVPGNHDTYVPGALDRICTVWQPYMSGDNQAESQFPYLRVRDGVALIGVNSGRATLPFMATGSFRQRQAQRLEELLSHAESHGLYRVVMIHHPPQKRATRRHKRLIGSGRFRATIAKMGADLILHGHTHLPTHSEIFGPKGVVPVIGVSAASQSPIPTGKKNGHSKPPAGYNLFHIERVRGNWSCTMQRYGYQTGGSQVVQLTPSIVIS